MNIFFKIIGWIEYIWIDKMVFPLFCLVADRCDNPFILDLWALFCFCFTAIIVGTILGQALGTIFWTSYFFVEYLI